MVEISCRAEDKRAVTALLPEALAEFRTEMTKAGYTVNPRVTVAEAPLASGSTVGGVILTALNNRIVLNQTMEERLHITYTDIMPDVRKGLFPV